MAPNHSLMNSIAFAIAGDNGDPARNVERFRALAQRCSDVRRSATCLADQPLSSIVQAMYRACLGCWQNSDDALWHHQEFVNCQCRQDELLFELRSLVELARSNAPPPLHAGTEAACLSMSDQDTEFCMASIESISAMINAAVEQGTLALTKPRSMPAAAQQPDRIPATLPPLIRENAKEDTTGQLTQEHDVPSLAVYLLNTFQVLIDGEPVSGWPNCRGKAIFKYLVAHRRRPTAKELLMETFWPDADPDAARNNLNVAVYGLRKILAKVNPSISYVLFHDDQYLLNPDLQIWVDSESFMDCVTRGRRMAKDGDREGAVREYRAAEAIYQSELLVEDRYEDWLIELRQQFQDTYLNTLEYLSDYYFEHGDYNDCTNICGKMLAVDACNEVAHRRAMCCYSRLGQPHLAIRQFRYCVESLAKELQLIPTPETTRLFKSIRAGQIL